MTLKTRNWLVKTTPLSMRWTSGMVWPVLTDSRKQLWHPEAVRCLHPLKLEKSVTAIKYRQRDMQLSLAPWTSRKNILPNLRWCLARPRSLQEKPGGNHLDLYFSHKRSALVSEQVRLQGLNRLDRLTKMEKEKWISHKLKMNFT